MLVCTSVWSLAFRRHRVADEPHVGALHAARAGGGGLCARRSACPRLSYAPRQRTPGVARCVSDVDDAAWLAALRGEFGSMEIRAWPQIGAADEFDYAFVWKCPPGLLASLPALKAVCSLAGRPRIRRHLLVAHSARPPAR